MRCRKILNISKHTYLCVKLYILLLDDGGPGTSIGVATDYGMDCPGPNPGGDEIFRPSKRALGLTEPPVKWVPVISRW